MTADQEIKAAVKAFYAAEFYDEQQGATFFRMPSGLILSSGTCTSVAEFLADALGRNHCVIVGYESKDNPKAKAGRDVGGHDFLIVDNEVIVDIWLREYENGPLLTRLSDAKNVKKWYGDKRRWWLSGSYAKHGVISEKYEH